MAKGKKETRIAEDEEVIVPKRKKNQELEVEEGTVLTKKKIRKAKKEELENVEDSIKVEEEVSTKKKKRYFRADELDPENTRKGRYSGSGHKQAGGKAYSEILRNLRLQEKSTPDFYIINMYETTRNSAHRLFSYICRTTELKDPTPRLLYKENTGLPLKDENGNDKINPKTGKIMRDKSTMEPIYVQKKDANGKVMVNKKGKPIYETTRDADGNTVPLQKTVLYKFRNSLLKYNEKNAKELGIPYIPKHNGAIEALNSKTKRSRKATI